MYNLSKNLSISNILCLTCTTTSLVKVNLGLLINGMYSTVYILKCTVYIRKLCHCFASGTAPHQVLAAWETCVTPRSATLMLGILLTIRQTLIHNVTFHCTYSRLVDCI